MQQEGKGKEGEKRRKEKERKKRKEEKKRRKKREKKKRERKEGRKKRRGIGINVAQGAKPDGKGLGIELREVSFLLMMPYSQQELGWSVWGSLGWTKIARGWNWRMLDRPGTWGWLRC